MQWISMILPAFLAVYVKEVLEKNELNWRQLIKTLGIYIVFINLFSYMICYFVFHISLPVSQCFDSYLFCIKLTLLNIAIAVLLPVFHIILSPYFHISMELKKDFAKGQMKKDE